VPVKPTVCGLPVALSVIATEAVRAPVAVGRKVTLMVQLAPAAKLDPQVVVRVKLVLLVPVMAMLEIVRTPAPLLVKVTDRAALVVFTVWFPKASDVGDKVTAGTTPEPVRLTV
jgi:hypothetical protein